MFGEPGHWTLEQGRELWRLRAGTSERFVLEQDGLTVAAAASFHADHHPTRRWAYIEVAEGSRRRGVATRAASELRQRAPEIGLRCKAEVGSAGEAFALSIGLEPLMCTRTLRVTGVPASPAVCSVEVVAASDAGHDVVDAWRRYYENGHRWDPTGSMPRSYWRETLGGPDDLVSTVELDGTIRGIAILGGAGDWAGGTVERDDPDAPAIVDPLIVAALQSCPVLEVEYDDWMVELVDVLARLHVEERDRSVILADPL